MRGTSNGRRLTDRLFGISLTLVGALIAILWGILWTNVSNAQTRISYLEGESKVFSVELRAIKELLTEIKDELRRSNP